MMKIIIIILFAMVSINTTYAITMDEMLNTVKNFWHKEDSIKMPDFSVIDLKGNTYTNKSTHGKYLLVNFWATWCAPCLKEIPAFVTFYKANQNKVLILGMSYEVANKQTITEFVDTFKVNYPVILFDKINEAQFTKFGKVLLMPTTYVYAPNGQLLDIHVGEMDITTLHKTILN